MSVDREQVKNIAVLARIAINEEQISATTERLGKVLELVNQLQAADTEGVEPMAHPMNASQRLRADAVTETNDRDNLQSNAPATENGLFLVPKVIE